MTSEINMAKIAIPKAKWNPVAKAPRYPSANAVMSVGAPFLLTVAASS